MSITRSQLKLPLFFLLIVSALALLAIIAAIVFTIVYQYVGLDMSSGGSALCSTYLTLKGEAVKPTIHSAIFIGSCIGGVLMVGSVVYLVVMVLKYGKSE